MEMWWATLPSSAICSDFLPNPDSRLTETDLYWRESPPPRTSQRNPQNDHFSRVLAPFERIVQVDRHGILPYQDASSEVRNGTPLCPCGSGLGPKKCVRGSVT